jgi:hypothetical protein
VWYRAVINQDGKVVQDGEVVTLVECRPPVRDAALTASETAPTASGTPSSNGSV